MSVTNFQYLHDESKDSVDLFLQMAKMGYLSIDSQQGREEKGQVPTHVPLYLASWSALKQMRQETWHHYMKRVDELYRKKLAKWSTSQPVAWPAYHKGYTMRERSYLIGFIRKEMEQVFLHFLNEYDMLGFRVVTVNTEKNFLQALQQSRIKVTSQLMNNVELPGGWPPNEIPYTTQLPMAMNLDALKGEFKNINAAQWKEFDEGHFRNKSHDFSKFSMITCVDPKHGRLADDPHGLFRRILSALEQTLSFIDINNE